MQEDRDELTLPDYLRILRRRWPWALAGLLFIVGSAGLFTVSRPPRYCSTAQVLLADSEAQVAILGDASVSAANRDLANELNIAASDRIRTEVVSQLGLEPEIDIAADDESDIIRFTGCGPTAADSASYANTWAGIYVDSKRQQAAENIGTAVEGFQQSLADMRQRRSEIRRPLDRLEDRLAAASTDEARAQLQVEVDRTRSDLEVELDLIDAQIQTIASTITQLQLDSELARTGTARLIQLAAEPLGPSNSSLPRNLVLATVGGLILGAGMALLAENLDRSLKTPEDVEGVPVLGAIPRANRAMARQELAVVSMKYPDSPIAEGYQKVRTALEFALLDRKVKSLLITSPSQGEGKSTTSTNLAWTMSAIDHRVVLVDVDFRRPRIHKVFDCPQEPGLSDHLLHGTPLDKLALRIDDERGQMVVMPTGPVPMSPGDFVASKAFSKLVRNLENEADLVIFDSTPVLPVPDALSIARQVDAVVVVAMAGRTSKVQLQNTVQALRGVGAEVIGVCLVGVKGGASSYRYERDAPIRARQEFQSAEPAPTTHPTSSGRPGAMGAFGTDPVR